MPRGIPNKPKDPQRVPFNDAIIPPTKRLEDIARELRIHAESLIEVADILEGKK